MARGLWCNRVCESFTFYPQAEKQDLGRFRPLFQGCKKYGILWCIRIFRGYLNADVYCGSISELHLLEVYCVLKFLISRNILITLKMSLYPSLEDMEAHNLIKAQVQAFQEINAPPSYSVYPPTSLLPSNAEGANNAQVYPSLRDYMGLELTPELLAINMPEYALNTQPQMQVSSPAAPTAPTATRLPGVIAPLSGDSVGLLKAQVSHGIRQVTLCKDAEGKVGLRVQAINKGIFVSLVQAKSPAALAGLRYGDQILQINGENMAGYSMDKVHEIFRKAGTNNIQLAVRDRPFERTLTLHKDSVGQVGFMFKDGKITHLVKDSSAARNGLLIDHNLLEVNGQNVVGLKDKEISKIIDEAGQVVTVTVMPSFLFEHMTKHIASSLIKKFMDHSVPDL